MFQGLLVVYLLPSQMMVIKLKIYPASSRKKIQGSCVILNSNIMMLRLKASELGKDEVWKLALSCLSNWSMSFKGIRVLLEILWKNHAHN